MSTTTTTDAIAGNLRALAASLGRAHAIACEASQAIAAGERNLAIGTLVDLEQLLPQAQALAGAIMALHRTDPVD